MKTASCAQCGTCIDHGMRSVGLTSYDPHQAPFSKIVAVFCNARCLSSWVLANQDIAALRAMDEAFATLRTIYGEG